MPVWRGSVLVTTGIPNISGVIRYKLKELEILLAEYGFIRVHKGYLVNARFVACVNNRDVVLNTGESIPLSKYHLKQVMEELERVI